MEFVLPVIQLYTGCDGFCIIPQNSEGVSAHEDVSVKLMKPLSDIEKTIVCTGSHDLILDIINDLMLKNRLAASVSSTHVGSMAGLIALSKKEAHIAPSGLYRSKGESYEYSKYP